MGSDQPKSKCLRCGRRAGQTHENKTVRFAKLAKNGRFDSLCIDCRFLTIDAKHSDVDDIRDDMRSAGIPIPRRG